MSNSINSKPKAARRTSRVSRRPAPNDVEPSGLQDAVNLFSSATGKQEESRQLDCIRLGENSVFVVPFTVSLADVNVHFANYSGDGDDGVRGYVQCNGAECVLCRVGNQKQLRHLLPVFDIEEGAVRVLGFTTNVRPRSLFAQLIPALRQVKDGAAPFLLEICKQERAEFSVVQHPLADDVNDGATAIATFLDALESGNLRLESAIATVSNEVLAAIPKIARVLTARRAAE